MLAAFAAVEEEKMELFGIDLSHPVGQVSVNTSRESEREA